MRRIEEIYSDVSNPAGLASIEKLYNALHDEDESVTKNQVKQFLATQNSYTLHKVTPNRFQRRRYLFFKPGYVLLGDVMYLNPLVKTNTPYLLLLMDGFSRYLHVSPLRSLKAKCVSPVIERIITNSIYDYTHIFSDEGMEFRNKIVQSMLKKHNVKWYTTYSKEIKCSVIERMIKTLKIKMSKYISHHNKINLVEILPKIVETYNHTIHKSLFGFTPASVYLMYRWSDISSLSKRIYINFSKKCKLVRFKHSVGDVVRIKSVRRQFSRVHYEQNTKELFKIITVNNHHVPISYIISELDNDVPISGIFYHQELTKVIDTGEYSIQILETRKDGNSLKYKVKFIDFPNAKEKWISSKNLTST